MNHPWVMTLTPASLAGVERALRHLPRGPWAVFGPDGEPVGDLDAAPTVEDMSAGGPAQVHWDGASTLTVTSAPGSRTAHLLTGRRADIGAVLQASTECYQIEHPYCRAHWHDPDIVELAIAVFDASDAAREEAEGYLEVVIEALEVPRTPQMVQALATMAHLAPTWTATVTDLLHVTGAIHAR